MSPAQLKSPSEYMNIAANPIVTSVPLMTFQYGKHETPTFPSGVPQQTAFADAITIAEIPAYCEAYLQDCALRLYSLDTIATRRVFLNNLIWFLNHKGYKSCGEVEIRHFFYYLMHGHESGEGRFGNKLLARSVRPVTVRDYYYCFRSFFDWLVTQRVLPETPFLRIAKPQVREEVKTALSPEQIAALLRATETSKDPVRNMAIVTFLLDTGCRANELVSIRVQDIDLSNGRCRILGKGNKYRTVFFGQRTKEALERYLSELNENDIAGGISDKPLFKPARGNGQMTRSGLLHLIKRLGATVGIKGEVSVHALRRSFAVQMLRNGANVFSVQAMLGHTNLQQTRKYCALALADSEAQHRQFSPMDGFVLAA